MGIWDFFIDLKIELNDATTLLDEYENSNLYRNIFHYGIIADEAKSEYIAGISSIIENFLPANNLIYSFLSQGKKRNGNFYIRTGGIERLFDFEKKSEFINFMYNTWETNIDIAYKNVGVIIINQNQHLKIRNKLYKKYHTKLTCND